MEILIRKAEINDKPRVMAVEASATPGLRYLPEMFEYWVHDELGELTVGEIAGELVGVAKFTPLPDGSAWLEALRVTRSAQGLGVAKLFYKRFFELAEEQGISVMRMYTGITNAASKGLAERFGFHLACTLRGAAYDLSGVGEEEIGGVADDACAPLEFVNVGDGERAWELLAPRAAGWGKLFVMNRTFYAPSPAMAAAWAKAGQVYYEAASDSLLILGARFQADRGLHIAFMSGDTERCLAFAEREARRLGVPRLICLYPLPEASPEKALESYGFNADAGQYIVMEYLG